VTGSKGTPVGSQEGELPIELDFFKYAPTDSGKRKATPSGEPESKKRRMNFAEEDEEDVEIGGEDDEGNTQVSAVLKHRVTAKGSNIPGQVETFAALQDRYQIPSHLLSNLSKSGYTQPTAIQSYGIPILLEVDRFTHLHSVYSQLLEP
jgi:ATP-dependent RNA helicase DDX52/ROK1